MTGGGYLDSVSESETAGGDSEAGGGCQNLRDQSDLPQEFTVSGRHIT